MPDFGQTEFGNSWFYGYAWECSYALLWQKAVLTCYEYFIIPRVVSKSTLDYGVFTGMLISHVWVQRCSKEKMCTSVLFSLQNSFPSVLEYWKKRKILGTISQHYTTLLRIFPTSWSNFPKLLHKFPTFPRDSFPMIVDAIDQAV